MKRILIISNIFLLLVIVILFIKGSFWDRSKTYIEKRLKIENEYNYLDNPRYKTYTEKFMLFNKQADIVMLGNSITFQIDWNELLGRTDIANRGISGDVTEGMLNRMNSVIKVKPKICFFMGGINDLTRRISYENTLRNIKSIVSILLKNNIIPIIQSVLYTNEQFYDIEHDNKYATIINNELKRFAVKEGLIFLDLNKDLSENGLLKSKYTYDGLHLNSKGYEVWGKIIKKLIDNGELIIEN